jgi:hypothetical protein
MVYVTNRPHVAVRLISIKFLFRHFSISSASNYAGTKSSPSALVIRANEFLFFNELLDDPPIELSEIFRKTLAENFETAMPTPEIPNSVSSFARRLALHFGSDIPFGSSKKSRPEPVHAKNDSKFRSLTFSNPEPAVDDEPRRW